jgi:uncharacterized protein (TIGR02246 family)
MSRAAQASGMNRLIIFVLFASIALRAAAGPKEDVAAATHAWVEAFASHDPSRITALYAPDAIFWGTASPTIRDTPELIREYFENLQNRPTVRIEIDEQHIRVYGDVAIDSGRYTVHEVKAGQPTVRPLRFSFVYRRQEGRWLIVDHHSSALPPAR